MMRQEEFYGKDNNEQQLVDDNERQQQYLDVMVRHFICNFGFVIDVINDVINYLARKYQEPESADSVKMSEK